jgi:hypothetical protein
MIFFFENLRNPARDRRAGLMRQFCSGQLDSSISIVENYKMLHVAHAWFATHDRTTHVPRRSAF